MAPFEKSYKTPTRERSRFPNQKILLGTFSPTVLRRFWEVSQHKMTGNGAKRSPPAAGRRYPHTLIVTVINRDVIAVPRIKLWGPQQADSAHLLWRLHDRT
jgi:hypothetical protein